eukprot:167746-Rhodomonas_salina.1
MAQGAPAWNAWRNGGGVGGRRAGAAGGRLTAGRRMMMGAQECRSPTPHPRHGFLFDREATAGLPKRFSLDAAVGGGAERLERELDKENARERESLPTNQVRALEAGASVRCSWCHGVRAVA